MKMRLPISLRGRRLLLVAALTAVASVGAVVAIMVLLSEPAESQPGSPVAHPELATPLPFPGYPATVHPPDTANPPRCQAPSDERPSPELPPFPCRYSGAEPPAGAIPTPAPGDALIPQNVPDGWQVVDNPLFRYTLAIPPDWYANMRPEGGEFYVLDPVALEEDAKGLDVPGGVAIHFEAAAYDPVDESTVAPEFVPVPQRHLSNPNAQFGSYEGSVWEDAGGEGTALIIRAAFVKDDVLFSIVAGLGDDSGDADVQAGGAIARQVLATITPY